MATALLTLVFVLLAQHAECLKAPPAAALLQTEVDVNKGHASQPAWWPGKWGWGGRKPIKPPAQWCGLPTQKAGLGTLIGDIEHGVLALDLTDKLSNGSTFRYLVTAVSVNGSKQDGYQYDLNYAYPMEETHNAMFELRLSPDGQSVDIFNPAMSTRTSEDDSKLAVERGTGSGWMGSMGIVACSMKGPAFQQPGTLDSMARGGPMQAQVRPASNPTDLHVTGNTSEMKIAQPPVLPTNQKPRIIIRLDTLIDSGFLVATSLSRARTRRVRKAQIFTNNLDVTADYMMGPGMTYSAGFSLVELPEAPMSKRAPDDRLLFFTTDYDDIGFHQPMEKELPENAADRATSTIWRYDLARLPDNQIRIYVDPTVPKRWRQAFKEGIELWKPAFAQAGFPDAIRGVLPEDEDWPADYDISDARFNTVAWTLGDQVVSMGVAKVDPRSGEIIKSDITMSSGWIRAWLQDLHIGVPEATSVARVKHMKNGYRVEKIEFKDDEAAKAVRDNGQAILDAFEGSPSDVAEPELLRMSDEGKVVSRTHNFLMNGEKKPMSLVQMNSLVFQGLRQVVAHEVGHIIGLRHNFKGSLGVSYECIQNKSCSSVHGLSSSVMDYLPMNVPPLDSDIEVDYFSPVVGAYDKLAISYGYTVANDSAAEGFQLNRLARAAEGIQSCYDEQSQGADPTCVTYDFTSDPLRYFSDRLDRLQEVQKTLLDTTVGADSHFVDYGSAVSGVLSEIQRLSTSVSNWIGGMNVSHVHRSATGSDAVMPRTPISAGDQRRALGILLRVVRARKNGLMPPEENLPYLVLGDHVGTVRSANVRGAADNLAKRVLSNLLAPDALSRLYEAEVFTLQEGPQKTSVLTTGEFLAKLVDTVVGDGMNSTDPQDWDLHATLIKQFKADLESSSLPEEVISHIRHHIWRMDSALERSYADLSASEERARSLSTENGWGEPEQVELLWEHQGAMRELLKSPSLASVPSASTRDTFSQRSGAAGVATGALPLLAFMIVAMSSLVF